MRELLRQESTYSAKERATEAARIAADRSAASHCQAVGCDPYPLL